MDWKCNEYENFTDLADGDRITALLLCEVLNLNFEYLYNFDKQTGYVGKWATSEIRVYPSIQDFAREYLYQGIEYKLVAMRGLYQDIPGIVDYVNLNSFGHRLLEEFGTDYAQLLPNGKVVTTDYGW